MQIVDPHIHFWELGTDAYQWLTSTAETFIGAANRLDRRFLPPDLFEGAKDIEIVKIVHVEALRNPKSPIDETRWLQSLADEGDFPQGIVAAADLSSPDVESILEQHRSFDNVRGIRQILNRHMDPVYNYVDTDYLNDSTWCHQFQLLKKFDLSFDLQLYPKQVPDACRIIDASPDTVFVLNHTGMFVDRTLEGYRQWRDGLAALSKRDNVFVKISGLGMFDHEWTVESFRPYVLQTLDFFGVERSMFASNFPVDKLFSDYVRVWTAFDEITQGFSVDERKSLFCVNAETVYRI